MDRYSKSFNNDWKPDFSKVNRCRKCGGVDIEIDISTNKRICKKCRTDEYMGVVNYDDVKDNAYDEINKVDERIPEGFPAPKL
jgi:hypothetical protein